MKLIENIKKIFMKACVFNTIGVLFIYSLALLLPNGEGLVPKLSYVWMVFAFSLILSVANTLLRVEKINLFVRILIHFAVVTAIFYVLFIVWGGFAGNASTTLVVLVVYTIVYALIMLVSLGIRYISEKTEKKDEHYESQFGGRAD